MIFFGESWFIQEILEFDKNSFQVYTEDTKYKSDGDAMKITKKEAAKVTHDINNVWHIIYKDKCGEICVIETHSHKTDSPGFLYYFINNDYDHYDFIAKYLII